MNGTPILRQRSASKSPTPGEVLAAITGKNYLSPSQVSTYQSCGLRWWFGYVAKAKPESTNASMAFGSAVHAAIQGHFEAMLCLEQPRPIDELVQVYREAFDKEASTAPMQFPKSDTPDSLQATAKQVLMAFLETPLAWPEGQILGIEETLRVRLAEDLPDLVGRVDLMTYHDGTLTITDYKTTRAVWTADHAEASSQQLSLYAQAAGPIAADLGATVKLRFVLLTKHKEPRVEELSVTADPDKVSRSTVIMRRVFHAMTTLQPYPNPSPMNCGSCPYQKRCQTWHLNQEESGR